MIEMTIRAGTTGAPDKLEQQDSWGKILPIIQGLVQQIVQLRSAGADAEPFVNLLKETIKRFDERLDVEQFITQAPPPAPAMPAMPPMAPGAAAPNAGMPMPPNAAPVAAPPSVVPPMQ